MILSREGLLRRAEAVTGRAWRLNELGYQNEGAVHPKPEQQRCGVRCSHARKSHHLHVHEPSSAGGGTGLSR